MAVLGRLLVSSAERLDLPDLLSIDSYAAGDWKYFLKGLVGDSKPYILKGFDVIDPTNAIGTQSCSIRVADSVTFYPGSSAGSFYHGLPEGHLQAVPLVPELRKNAVNYVYLTFSTFNTSIDTRAFWDPDKDGGVGGEFTQDVNTESVLEVQVNVSTGSFPANTVPVAKITVGPVVITAIEDARDLMFRLGSGGVSPDPFNTYGWRSLPGSGFTRTEPPTNMQAGGANPFQGADKNILTLKEWMDAVMSKLRELGGTTYWYDDTSSFGIVSNFFDAVATFYKSKGQWIHSSATPGMLTWTEDIQIKLASDLRSYIIRAGSKTLANEEVMYIPMVRNQPVNSTDEAVSWTNGQAYINTVGGAVGLFANLTKGDFVRKANDSIDKWLRVEEFYDAINLGGSVTTAVLARSVRLSSVYLGTTIVEKARYDKGAYLASDVVVSTRDAATIANTGGNFHWLAIRSDTIENIGSAVSHTISLAISEHDGATAKVVSTAHGLVDGDRITITGTTNFNGVYKVEVETADIFYITKSGGPFANESGSGFYAIITTAARFNAFGFQEESANHGFRSDDTIIVDGTTNFNGSYLINVRNATQFEITPSSAPTPTGPNLASASTFGILAKSAITNSVGTSTVNGDLGESPGSTLTGAITVTGATHLGDGTAATAQVDANAAYVALAAHAGYVTIANDLGTVGTLSAGYYTFAAGDVHLAQSGPQTLTLNGSATDVFVFKTPSTLTTGAGGMPTITLTGGALAANVYWVVGSAATINVGVSSAGGIFQGTILAATAITVTQGGTVNGRLISTTASGTAITLSNVTTVNAPAGGGSSVTETTGTATLARIIVRDEGTGVSLIQGEIVDIGGTTADNIRQFIGMGSLSETFPAYAVSPSYNTLDGMQNYNGVVTEHLTSRVSKLTAMMADKAQDKTVKYLPTSLLLVGNTTNGANQEITFDVGSTLTILLPGSPGNAVVTLPDASPGISLAVNQSAYVSVDRNNATTPSIIVVNTTAVPIDENVFVIAERLNSTDIYLWDSRPFGLGVTPFAGSGTGIRQVDLYNPINTTLPTGLVTIDNVSVIANMQVLFSNLSSGNNEIYKANGVGTSITSWTAQFAFHGTVSPQTGDLVIITQGQNFANQIGEFNGTTWLFNSTVRHFNGVDYWEQSALITSTLVDNTTNGTVFSVNYVGSENMIVDYSIIRGSLKETASLYITTDGVNVSVAEGGTNLNGTSGVTFDGIISGSLIILRYTTTATGIATTMKYSVKRWSDSAGGPGGIPSYTGAAGSGVTSVNGLAGAVTIAAGANVTITPSGNTLTIDASGGGTPLSPGLTINNNVASPAMIFTYNAAANNFAVIEYSILRNGAYRVGRLLVTNDGSVTSSSDDFVQTAVTGVVLSADISAGNVRVLYTSTNTGFSGTLKYSMRSWS